MLFPDWMDRAACRGHDPELWFVEHEPGPNEGSYRHARRVFERCEVSSECLAYAFTEHIEHGMWGGYSPHERRRMKRKRVA